MHGRKLDSWVNSMEKRTYCSNLRPFWENHGVSAAGTFYSSIGFKSSNSVQIAPGYPYDLGFQDHSLRNRLVSVAVNLIGSGDRGDKANTLEEEGRMEEARIVRFRSGLQWFDSRAALDKFSDTVWSCWSFASCCCYMWEWTLACWPSGNSRLTTGDKFVLFLRSGDEGSSKCAASTWAGIWSFALGSLAMGGGCPHGGHGPYVAIDSVLQPDMLLSLLLTVMLQKQKPTNLRETQLDFILAQVPWWLFR